MGSPWRSWIDAVVPGALALALGVFVSTAGCSKPAPAPFTREEVDRALTPAQDLWQRCYAGGRFERAGTVVIVEYRLNVEADGTVRSVPTRISPEDPSLVECVRHRLDQLRFPARGKDHIDVHFELGPHGSSSGSEPRGARLGTCDPPCGDGFSCHYEAGAAPGVCRVAQGRCRFDRDCAPAQICQRFSEPLGVCVERSP